MYYDLKLKLISTKYKRAPADMPVQDGGAVVVLTELEDDLLLLTLPAQGQQLFCTTRRKYEFFYTFMITKERRADREKGGTKLIQVDQSKLHNSILI